MSDQVNSNNTSNYLAHAGSDEERLSRGDVGPSLGSRSLIVQPSSQLKVRADFCLQSGVRLFWSDPGGGLN